MNPKLEGLVCKVDLKFMKRTILLLSLVTSLSASAAAPDLILFNGKVFTSDAAHPNVEALAISGERIVEVGTTKSISALAGPKTKRIDLGGRVVVPGFNDAHYHHMPNPEGVMVNLPMPPGAVVPEPTWDEVLAALPAAVEQARKGEWIYASVGQTVVNDPRFTREPVDRLAPENPVLVSSWFGHGNLFNTAAMRRVGLGEEQPDPMGGRFPRFAGTQRITGVVCEYAGWPAFRALEESCTDDEIIRSLKQLAGEAAQFGITSIQNMTYLTPRRYVELLRRADFPLRMRVIRWPATDTHGRDLKEGLDVPLHPSGAPRVTVSGTKWVLDGSPLERGMAVRGEYRDRPGWSGTVNFSDSEIRAMLRETVARKDQSLLHAVGDKTVEAVLNAMEAVDAEASHWPARRVRIEHGDGLLPDLLPRAKAMGVVVVQNPTHFDPGVAHFFERFGTNHPYLSLRSLAVAGIPLAFGSDGPMNPGLNILFAQIHPARPGEGISREESVVAYTRGSAFAEFAENEKGSLAAGKLADLAVLSQDIFQVPPPELPKTVSLLTLVGGKIVHDSGALGGSEAKATQPTK
jgi:predicted amidohydrolase YtcJ